MIITKLSEFQSIEDKDLWVLDIESKGTDYTKDAKILGFGFTFISTGQSCYVPIRHWNRDTKDFTPRLSEEGLIEYIAANLSKRKLVVHNSSFDIAWLRYIGSEPNLYWDTRIAWHILDPEYKASMSKDSDQVGRYSLDEAIVDVLHKESHKEVTLSKVKLYGGKKGDYYLLPLEELATYCIADTKFTSELYIYQKPILEDLKAVNFMQDYQFKYASILTKQKEKGMFVDKVAMLEYKTKLLTTIDELQNKIEVEGRTAITQVEEYLLSKLLSKLKTQKAKDAVLARKSHVDDWKFNFNSRQHSAMFFENLGVKIEERTDKGGVSTSSDTLEKYKEHPVVGLVVERNDCKDKLKFVEQYLEVTSDDNIYHGEGDICATSSGRIAYFKPNFVAIPRRDKVLMDCFKAREGFKLVQFDFSSVEPVVECHYTKDEELRDIVINKKDMYLELVKYIFPSKIDLYDPTDIKGSKERLKKERDILKTVRLGLGYGMGIKKLALSLKIDQEEAYKISKAYWQARYKVKELNNNLAGLLIDYHLDRTKPLKNLLSRPIIMQDAKDIVNRFIQSSAHDCLIALNILLDPFVCEEHYPIVCDWHDEGIWEVKENKVEEFKTVLFKGIEDLNKKLNLFVPLSISHKVVDSLGGLEK